MFCLASKYQEVHVFAKMGMPHALKIGRKAAPEFLSWTASDVGEHGFGQVRLRKAEAGLNYIAVYHRSGYYPQPLPFIPGLEGAGTVEAVAHRSHCARSAVAEGFAVSDAPNPLPLHRATRCARSF